MALRRHGDPENVPPRGTPARPDGLKMCPGCGIPKESVEFCKAVRQKSGLNSWCRVCCSLAQAKRYRSDPERRRQVKESRVERTYGLSPEGRSKLSKIQAGVCAICKNPEIPSCNLYVDHDHSSGKVRGLLCGPCNTALGMLKESVASAESLIRYLQEHSRGLASIATTTLFLGPEPARSLVPPAPSCLAALCSKGCRAAHCLASLLPTP